VTGPLALAHVTPYAWEDDHEVNDHVHAVTDALAARGHRVLVIAPSHSPDLVRESRRTIRGARDGRDELLPEPGTTRVLGVGEVLVLSGARRRAASLPIDVARTIEAALATASLDVVHVHEPWAPSTSSAALRHSRALNVGTFHAPTERILSTQVARRVVQLVFGRLDARVASYRATCELLRRFFPGEYRVVLPGAAAAPTVPDSATFAFADAEERAALRVFLRALRRLPDDLPWRARVRVRGEGPPASALRREVRERIEWVRTDDPAVPAGAQIPVFASSGLAPAPGALLRALAAGGVPVASRLEVYEELLGEGERGLVFEPGDVDVLAAQMSRLASDAALRDRLREAAAPLRSRLGWERVAADLDAIYLELVARRHDDRGQPAVRARLRERPLIDVDLHMHTDHSHDCATPVEVLLAEARDRGLGAVAVTDHNEISGAREAAAKADGVKVIVGEEIKTAGQGEVIGLFLSEKISRGMTLEETIAEIKRQGGLVYVPHPFDRLHSVPDYEHLLAVLDDVDAIEVFNPRVAISEFNEEAVRFAAKYRIPAGAGSDAHVPQGLGSVRIRMRAFDGPEEFLESLREADIIRRPSSLLYVQALKFLQTRATPEAARRAVRERRVRRAARKG
jgi:predicted metal-dependent phosphoesterase TrpH/glycosyltransferase involved in cell wall biosynthesis